MSSLYTPQADYTRVKTARAVLALAQFLCMVPDSAGDRTVKLPTTSSVPTNFAGITNRPAAAGVDCELIFLEGDTAVATASGTVTKGDNVYLDTAAGKEGKLKTYVDFPTNGRQLIVGFAKTTCADGEIFEVEIRTYFRGDGEAVGTATLVAGQVVVANSLIKATSKVFLSVNTPGLGVQGARLQAREAAYVASTSFLIESTNLANPAAVVATDISTINWRLVI